MFSIIGQNKYHLKKTLYAILILGGVPLVSHTTTLTEKFADDSYLDSIAWKFTDAYFFIYITAWVGLNILMGFFCSLLTNAYVIDRCHSARTKIITIKLCRVFLVYYALKSIVFIIIAAFSDNN